MTRANKSKPDRITRFGNGSIGVRRDLLSKLRPGELGEIVSLVQGLCNNLLDDLELSERAVNVHYGNPWVVNIYVNKLAKVDYDIARQALLKLSDMQRSAVSEEAAKIERVLGKL